MAFVRNRRAQTCPKDSRAGVASTYERSELVTRDRDYREAKEISETVLPNLLYLAKLLNMARKVKFTHKNGKTVSSDFIYPNEMKDTNKLAGAFKSADIDTPKLSKKERDKISKESFGNVKDELVELSIGNIKIKATPLKIRPKSKKKILVDAAKAKGDHQKMNHTRTAAWLTARKMKPCK